MTNHYTLFHFISHSRYKGCDDILYGVLQANTDRLQSVQCPSTGCCRGTVDY